jgi:hypothetical protein
LAIRIPSGLAEKNNNLLRNFKNNWHSAGCNAVLHYRTNLVSNYLILDKDIVQCLTCIIVPQVKNRESHLPKHITCPCNIF